MTEYMPPQRTCSACGTVKPRADFAINRTTPSGLANHCKACSAEYKREYRRRMSQRRLEWLKAQAQAQQTVTP